MSGTRGHAADPVETLEDVEAVFDGLGVQTRNGRPRNPVAVVRCAYCGTATKRVIRDVARSWFVTHSCASPFAALAKRRFLYPIRDRNPAYLELVQAARYLWEMMYVKATTDVLYRGGVSYASLPPVTAEAQAHHARVDDILVRILGGVPRPRAPRPAAKVIPLFPPLRAEAKKAAA